MDTAEYLEYFMTQVVEYQEKVRKNSNITPNNNKTYETKKVRSNNRFPALEEEKKVLKTMDCRNYILLYKNNVWRTRICNQVSNW